MSPADRFHVLLFLAGFCGAVGFLCMLLSCGTEYWLLVSEEEEEEEDEGGRELEPSVETLGVSHGKTTAPEDEKSVRLFHEGLFWRCSFRGSPDHFSVWSLWIISSEVCEPAFLFPFPVHRPIEPHHLPVHTSAADSAIVFRTFWSVFLIMGVVTVVIGGFLVICAAPLANHRLYKAGGAFQLSGGVCLLGVVVMFVMWIHVLDTLEQFASQQRLATNPAYRLTVHNGPSFLLAPAAAFFCLLSGLLFITIGRQLRVFQNKC